MGMGPYLPFLSWVWFKIYWTKLRFRLIGLESKLVKLEDGVTTIHCWVPKESAHGSESTDQKPALLLIQGFGMNGALGWAKQVPAFAKKFRVYVPDLLFFGQSYTTDSRRSEIFQCDCLKKMLDVLKVDRTHVVGTSYGGMVAYQMASRYPSLVNKLVVSSSGVMMTPTTNQTLLKLANVSNVKEILIPENVKYLRKGLSLATTRRLWFIPNFVFQDMFDWFYKHQRGEKAELIDGMITGTVGAPPVPIVPQDVLIVWGTQDKIFQPDLAEKLKNHLGARANLVYIQKSGHVPQIEHASLYSSHIIKFLSK